MKTILVQMSDKRWTTQAVHLACALARNNQARVILLRLAYVQHPGYLGTDFGTSELTAEESVDISEYASTAEDYGVEISVQPMQCLTLLDAVADAAEQLQVHIVFAHVPESRVSYWHRFQMWNLRRRLSQFHCQLFTLDESDANIVQAPSIEVRPLSNTTVRDTHRPH